MRFENCLEQARKTGLQVVAPQGDVAVPTFGLGHGDTGSPKNLSWSGARSGPSVSPAPAATPASRHFGLDTGLRSDEMG